MGKPFLRWAGGKRWLARILAPIIRERLGDGTYFEPFLGSGAMFFALAPQRAVLSDLNQELVLAYQQVARHSERMVSQLQRLPASKEVYYELRHQSPLHELDRAVRFLYLNRNCYGGLHRENRAGKFNVPYGGPARNHLGIIMSGTLPEASQLLSKTGVQVLTSDFEPMLALAGERDVVYCDPTYRAVMRGQFDRYGKIVFGWEDQVRLAEAATLACSRGSLVIVSNTSCLGLRDLYPAASIFEVVRPKGIGPRKNETIQAEYLFVLDPINRSDDWTDVNKLTLINGRNRMTAESAHQVSLAK